MKKAKNLFEKVSSWDNLLLAAKKARKRKRFRADVMNFEFDLEEQLLKIQAQLNSNSYLPGRYYSFEIFDPKHRLISAAPYFDRVVHHAVCNVVEPIFDRTFIFDSYACRKGKGQNAALQRAQQFSRRFPFVLKTDIRKFFPSMDHDVVMALVDRRIGDSRLLNLINSIVRMPFPGQIPPRYFPGDDLFAVAERSCGLPIGNQTSQLLANVYLDPIDHFLKEEARVSGYLRYMDDLLIFGNSKLQLWKTLYAANEKLAAIRLRRHPRKTNLISTKSGIPFLGFRIFPDCIRIPSAKLTRFRRRLCLMQKAYEAGALDFEPARQSLYAYWGHFQQAKSTKLLRDMLNDYSFVGWIKEQEQERKNEKLARMKRELRRVYGRNNRENFSRARFARRSG